MQRDMDEKSQKAKKPPVAEYSFKPKINEAKTAEMMVKLQNAFQKQLEKKKGQFTATVPEGFNFSKSKSRALDRTQFNEGGPESTLGSKMMDPLKAAMAKKLLAKKSEMSQVPTK